MSLSKVIVLGGSGYAGAAIVSEAALQGHEVVSVSRTLPNESIDGVSYIEGSVIDANLRAQVFDGADVIIGALSPRGDMAGELAPVYKTIAQEALRIGARFIVIGGFGSLRPAEGAPRFAEGPDFPADYKDESLELLSVLTFFSTEALEELDWLYVSPAAEFSGYNPGEKTGKYVISGSVAVFNEAGVSQLSSQDLALAVIDEVGHSEHHREHISVAY